MHYERETLHRSVMMLPSARIGHSGFTVWQIYAAHQKKYVMHCSQTFPIKTGTHFSYTITTILSPPLHIFRLCFIYTRIYWEYILLTTTTLGSSPGNVSHTAAVYQLHKAASSTSQLRIVPSRPAALFLQRRIFHHFRSVPTHRIPDKVKATLPANKEGRIFMCISVDEQPPSFCYY